MLFADGAPIATLPSTEATDSPNPSPGEGVVYVNGGVNESGVKTGGDVVDRDGGLRGRSPAESVVDGQRDGVGPRRQVGVGRLGARRRPSVAERPGVGERVAVGTGRARAVEGDRGTLVDRRVVKPITAVGGLSPPNSCENSEVLPPGSVAVAVTNWAPPAGVGNENVKLALPATSVVSDCEPSTYRPSP